MQREVRPATFWYALVEEFENSGFTQAEFAYQKGVNVSTFRRWLYKSRAESIEETAQFVELSTLRKPREPSVFLSFPSGLRLEFSTAPEPSYFASLLQALEESC